MTDKDEIVMPTININGTDGKRLLEEVIAASLAIEKAMAALGEMTVHGRDHQTAPAGSFVKARAQHGARLAQLFQVRDELLHIANGLYAQIGERAKTRRPS